MKTKFGFSSKMHLFIIVSSVILAIGLAVGIICQFVAGGFFNYGGEKADYKCIKVTYQTVEFGDEADLLEICDKAFADQGLSPVSTPAHGVTSIGGEYIYKFGTGVDDKKLNDAKDAINSEIRKAMGEENELVVSISALHSDFSVGGGVVDFNMTAVVISVIVVLHFIYFLIRYRLTMALAAVTADLHNLALYVALLAMTRIPVATSALAFAVMTVLVTVIGTSFFFDRMRKNCKNEDNRKLTAFELCDKSANESCILNIVFACSMAVVALLMLVFMAISAMSLIAILAPVMCAFVCFVCCAYGTALFTPSVYSRYKQMGDEYKASHTRKTKERTSK